MESTSQFTSDGQIQWFQPSPTTTPSKPKGKEYPNLYGCNVISFKNSIDELQIQIIVLGQLNTFFSAKEVVSIEMFDDLTFIIYSKDELPAILIFVSKQEKLLGFQRVEDITNGIEVPPCQ